MSRSRHLYSTGDINLTRLDYDFIVAHTGDSYPRHGERQVMAMAAADHGGLDHYQLLGVPRQASREEIAQAWRRRARDEHPDARPADAGAPGRFRALAEAWQVLGDPDRRAAYDQALASQPQPAARVRVTVRRIP